MKSTRNSTFYALCYIGMLVGALIYFYFVKESNLQDQRLQRITTNAYIQSLQTRVQESERHALELKCGALAYIRRGTWVSGKNYHTEARKFLALVQNMRVYGSDVLERECDIPMIQVKINDRMTWRDSAECSAVARHMIELEKRH